MSAAPTATAPAAARVRRLLSALAAAALVAAGLGAWTVTSAAPASAAVASAFSPGNIISDPVFHDSGSMTAGQVQSFLADRVGSCASGATCLVDFTQTTWTRTDSKGVCSTYQGASNETAAQIIVNVAQACGINPQVLLVLLQKEQGLVTATAPSASKYSKATGFGCPDTAAGCDSQYNGFFNQVYLAAHQFDLYTANPAKYSYQAGRSNYIQWNPTSSCGGSQIWISNSATAALYNYTPYAPNTAAMSNLYGSGDSCSAYGNRNFWRYFTDWFGSPQSGGFFVHAAGDPAVYLVTTKAKLPVSSMALVSAFAPLGSIGTVSASYLAALPTGAPLGPVVTDDDGAIYVVDRGATHHVGTCDLVADLGAACGSLPLLSDVQISDLRSGDPMTETIKSTSSPVVWVAGDGRRHEVLDWSSLVASGASTTITSLAASTLALLPVGVPVARPDVVVTARDSGQEFLLSPDGASLVPPGLAGLPSYTGRVAGALEAASIRALGFTPTQDGAVTDGDEDWLLTSDGHRLPVTSGALGGLAARTWTSAMLATAPEVGSGDPTSAAVVQGAGSAAVYRVADTTARPVGSWADLQVLAGASNPSIAVVPAATVRAMTTGAPVYAPAAVVKTTDSGDVWVLDGTGQRYHLPSFTVASALGLPSLRTLPAGALAGYAARGDLSTVVTCSSAASATTAVGLGGSLRALPSGTSLPATSLDATTCARLRTGAALGTPVAVQEKGTGTVWLVTGTAKRAVASWAALVKALGTASPTIVVVPAGTLSGLTAGAVVS